MRVIWKEEENTLFPTLCREGHAAVLLGERMFVFGGNAAQVRRPAAACAHPIPPLECFRARIHSASTTERAAVADCCQPVPRIFSAFE